jgi:hypothetical protein
MQSKSELPSAYQQVEYIESQGAQIITLDYIVQEDDTIDFTFYLVQDGESHLTHSTDGITGIWYNYASRVYVRFAASSSTLIGSASFWQVRNVKLKKGKINDNGEIISLPFNSMPNVPQNIFAGRRPNNTYYSYSYARIYAYSIYNENETKINLIPCYRKSDGEIGLYDTINKKFYTNLGTGEFLKGADI